MKVSCLQENLAKGLSIVSRLPQIDAQFTSPPAPPVQLATGATLKRTASPSR